MDGVQATPGAASSSTRGAPPQNLLNGNIGGEGFGGSRRIGSGCTHPEAARIPNVIADEEEKK